MSGFRLFQHRGCDASRSDHEQEHFPILVPGHIALFPVRIRSVYARHGSLGAWNFPGQIRSAKGFLIAKSSVERRVPDVPKSDGQGFGMRVWRRCDGVRKRLAHLAARARTLATRDEVAKLAPPSGRISAQSPAWFPRRPTRGRCVVSPPVPAGRVRHQHVHPAADRPTDEERP